MKFLFKKTYPSSDNFFLTNNNSHHKDTLTHVMHLFEEKNKYSPAMVTGPLPIKANGAIVVNRPLQSNHNKSQMGSIRSLPVYLQDEPPEIEEDIMFREEEERDISDMRVTTRTIDESSLDDDDEEEEKDLVYLIHEENKRLRQQILLEREESEKWRLGQDKLKKQDIALRQTVKNLERRIQRFQKIISLPTTTTTTNGNHQKRRLSTGMNIIAVVSHQDIISSYEHKLQILLNEIHAMEYQENDYIQQLTLQKNECEKLNRKLKYKDDIIRQLAYDVQFEKRKDLIG